MLGEDLRDVDALDHTVEPSGSLHTSALAAGAIVAVVRFLVSRSRTTFAIWPDEPAQLAMARFLGGGTAWNMHDHSTWRPGYALLLSPVYWFTDDATTVFRSAMVLNAVLGGVATILLIALARRLTSLAPWPAAIASVAVMTMPAMLFVTDFVWSESLVVTLFLASMLALIRFDEIPGVGRGCLAAAAVTCTFATHSRMLPLVAILVTVVGMAMLRDQVTKRDGAVVVVVALVGAVAVQRSSSAIVARLWRNPADTNTVGAVAERIVDVGPLVVSAAGQWWYLLVSSLGLVGFGVWGLARRVRDSGKVERRSAAIVAASTLACVALSVAFMSARDRPDRIVYGRYNDGVIAPILVVGIAVLVGALGTVGRRHLAVATGITGGSLLATGAVLVAFRNDPLTGGNGVEPMILGLQPFIGRSSSIQVVPITIVAAALLVASTLLVAVVHGRAMTAGRRGHARSVRPIAGLALAVGALLVVGGVRTADAIGRGWNDARDVEQLQSLADGPLADGEPVDFYVRAGSDDTKAMMNYQFALASTEFTVIEDFGSGTARFVVAPSDAVWPPDRPARVVWDDPTRPISLWERGAVD